MNVTFDHCFSTFRARFARYFGVGTIVVALPLLAFAKDDTMQADSKPMTVALATTPQITAPVQPSAIPASQSQMETLLKQAAPDSPALWQAVANLIKQQSTSGNSSAGASPAMMIVSYRPDGTGVRDVVVQLYGGSSSDVSSILNPQGTVRGRLGDDLYNSADNFLGLIYRKVTYLGQSADVQRQQRAINSTMDGDLTLLREQTVDPLHVVAIMPEAKQFLPGSLSTRVNSVVLNAELSFGEWKGKVGLITANNESAQAVGTIVSAWKEMAVSLAETFAAQTSGKPLQEALKSTNIEVADNQVFASATIPSATIVRATKELTGHGAPKKIDLCYHGQSIEVMESQERAYLERGATVGPCHGDHDHDHDDGHGDDGRGGRR